MNQQIQTVINNLQQIYQTWLGLSDESKKKKINQILPFINLVSYLDGLFEVAALPQNQELKEILEDFSYRYQDLLGTDITKMQASDFSPEMMKDFEKIQSGKSTANEATKIIIASKWIKYEHAHSRVMFNYGRMLKTIQDERPAIANGLKQKAAELLTGANPDITALLFEINEQFNIEQNAEAFAKDDLENHALLNQSTNYKNHLALANILLEENGLKNILASLTQTPQKRVTTNVEMQRAEADKNVKSITDFDLWSQKRAKDTNQKFELQVGIESEFLLRQFKSALSKVVTQNDKIKIALADLNSRRKMQTKYGKAPTVVEIKDVRPFLIDEELEAKHPRRLDISIIQRDVIKSLDLKDENEIAEVKKEIGRFTEAEIYFYKLLFLNEDHQLPIEIDGVYDYKKSKIENLKHILPFIKTGILHEKLLDMIRAHEVSIGPFDISATLPAIDKTLSAMHLAANQTGLSLEDPNVQLNLSFWMNGKNALMPEIKKEGENTTMQISALGREIMGIIATTVAQNADVAGILRSQQFIEVNFDRKKIIGEELKGTPFLDIDPNQTAFTNHKKLAAKTATIRASVAVKDKVSVAEIRLVGNNPHFATFGDAEEFLQPGLTFIPHILLPEITKNIQNFLDSKSQDELQTLSDSKVNIGYDGRIEGLEPVKVEEIKKIDQYDPTQKTSHDPLKHGVRTRGAARLDFDEVVHKR